VNITHVHSIISGFPFAKQPGLYRPRLFGEVLVSSISLVARVPRIISSRLESRSPESRTMVAGVLGIILSNVDNSVVGVPQLSTDSVRHATFIMAVVWKALVLFDESGGTTVLLFCDHVGRGGGHS
jgi:hypothetical protein